MSEKNILSPNPHPVGTAEARAWEAGYWQGRKDIVAQTSSCPGCGAARTPETTPPFCAACGNW